MWSLKQSLEFHFDLHQLSGGDFISCRGKLPLCVLCIKPTIFIGQLAMLSKEQDWNKHHIVLSQRVSWIKGSSKKGATKTHNLATAAIAEWHRNNGKLCSSLLPISHHLLPLLSSHNSCSYFHPQFVLVQNCGHEGDCIDTHILLHFSFHYKATL